MQNIDYSDTFHQDQIDKRIMIETEYVLRKKWSKKHGWLPTLLFRLFDMTFNNAYKVYCSIAWTQHQQDKNETARITCQSLNHWIAQSPKLVDRY